VVVTNTGTSSVTFTSISTSAEFAETNSCGTTLAVGASCSIAISFTPAAPGVRTGTLTISGSGLSAPLTAELQGTAVTVNNLPRPVMGLTITPANPVVGQTVSIVANLAAATGAAAPTGNVTFTSGSDGTTILGKAAVDGSGNATLNLSSLTAGTYKVFAAYAGDTAYNIGSSPVGQFTVSSTAATATTLAASATTVTVGSALTLTATVTSTSDVPVGSVNFLDGATLLGSGTLNSSGVGTLSISTLTLGGHTLTAQYAGSGVFTLSVSTAVQESVVAAPDYSVGTTPSLLTISRGLTGTASFAITPLNGYAGTIMLTCGALPTDATCSFSPTQIVFAAASQSLQSATLTIGTKQLALLAPERKLWQSCFSSCARAVASGLCAWCVHDATQGALWKERWALHRSDIHRASRPALARRLRRQLSTNNASRDLYCSDHNHRRHDCSLDQLHGRGSVIIFGACSCGNRS